MDYYTDVAISIPSDEYFAKYLEDSWGIFENEEYSVPKSRVRYLIGLVRIRLLAISNNNLEDFMLRKIFKDFDIDGSGAICLDELTAMLAKLSISFETKEVQAILNELDLNKSGMIEFDEFAAFLLYDPYK